MCVKAGVVTPYSEREGELSDRAARGNAERTRRRTEGKGAKKYTRNAKKRQRTRSAPPQEHKTQEKAMQR